MIRKILFLVPYPLKEAPSQRFRFEQYFDLLRSSGYSYNVQSFLSPANWRSFFGAGNNTVKAWSLISGFVRRVAVLFQAISYDFIFVHREVTPLGPPIFEWILANVLRKKIIYDFDDAIWLTDRTNESWMLRAGKWRSKVGSICKWSHKVSCGNNYLCNYAAQFSKDVIYNPTTIDTDALHNPALYNRTKKESSRVVIGWTGSHSTLKYLKEIEHVLRDILLDDPQVEFVVIADKMPKLSTIPARFIPWSAETEINDLLQFDIGIMPLPDDEWAQGKCGFKALQYMSLEFPAVASPVGVNSTIITNSINGFLCSTPEEWNTVLRQLIRDPKLRSITGAQGRRTILERYSVRSNSSNFLSLFE